MWPVFQSVDGLDKNSYVYKRRARIPSLEG